MKEIFKKSLISLILVIISFSCKDNRKLENDIIWQKYLESEVINLKFYATKINYENYTIFNKKEKLSKFEFNVNIIKKNSGEYEKEYIFLKGVINGIEINESNNEVKSVIELLKKPKRKNYFFDKNIKTKIVKTNKNKIINNYKCIGYSFTNKIKEENGKTSKEIGTIWFDIESGRDILCEYEGKLSLLDTYFLPVKMNTRISTKYNGLITEEIINETEIKVKLFKFFNSYNKLNIVYSEYKKL
jgi:hypothetical protein